MIDRGVEKEMKIPEFVNGAPTKRPGLTMMLLEPIAFAFLANILSDSNFASNTPNKFKIEKGSCDRRSTPMLLSNVIVVGTVFDFTTASMMLITVSTKK